MPYSICLLLALIAGILPAAIFPDFLTSLQYWDNQYGPQAIAEHRYSGSRWHPILRAERAVFTALVVPPSVAAEVFGRLRTEYARLVLPDRYITETLAGTPPFFVARENFLIALPFWFIVFLLIFECGRWFRRRRVAEHAA